MSEPGRDTGTVGALRAAAAEVERSRRRLASTIGALQYRLRPGNLMNHAWDEVRDKGSEVADSTLQAVRNRPAAASGVLAGIVLFLAREPIRKSLSSLLSRKTAKETAIEPDIDPKENYDLAAPTVTGSTTQGVNA